jgi:hypothetical protein
MATSCDNFCIWPPAGISDVPQTADVHTSTWCVCGVRSASQGAKAENCRVRMDDGGVERSQMYIVWRRVSCFLPECQRGRQQPRNYTPRSLSLALWCSLCFECHAFTRTIKMTSDAAALKLHVIIMCRKQLCAEMRCSCFCSSSLLLCACDGFRCGTP